MRHLRLFPVLIFSTMAITGCHHKRQHVAPPAKAQAPIVTTLPPIPPLTFPDVQIAKPKPPPPPVETEAPEEPEKTPAKQVHRRHREHQAEPTVPETPPPDADSPAPVSGAAVLGQLSADDAAANPHQNSQIQNLIQEAEGRLKKISSEQRAAHKDSLVQVNAFLAQAKQALGMNDLVGAQTLADKAKILLDEILK